MNRIENDEFRMYKKKVSNGDTTRICHLINFLKIIFQLVLIILYIVSELQS